MITAAKLAGFFAAHAIWCVSDGESLTPMLAYTTAKNDRQLVRLVAEDLAASVALGNQKLQSNDMDANDAALLFDGYLTLEKEKVDAVIIEIRAYFFTFVGSGNRRSVHAPHIGEVSGTRAKAGCMEKLA